MRFLGQLSHESKKYSKARLTFSVLSLVSNFIGSTFAFNLYLLCTDKITGAYRWKKVAMMPVQTIVFCYLWSSMNK